MKVEYSSIKSNIVKACKATHKEEPSFIVNYEKLNRSINNIGLTMLNVGTKSERVNPKDIPFMSEYFVGKDLQWLDEDKDHTTLVFVDNDAIDDTLSSLIKDLEDFNDRDIDRTKTISNIVANYPCYFAEVVSYVRNDPNYFGELSYHIICRANKVIIRSVGYTNVTE